MKKTLFVFLLFMTTVPAFCQNAEIDSLVTLIKNSSVDSVRIRELNNLAEAYNNQGMVDSAYAAVDRSMKLNDATKGFFRGPYCMIYSYAALSNIEFDKGNFEKSRSWSRKALTISRMYHYGDRTARLYKDIGDTFGVIGTNDSALYYYRLCLDDPHTKKDQKSTADCCINIGDCYQQMGETGMALIYYTIAEKAYEKMDYLKGMALSTGGIGSIYDKEGKSDKALDYYLKALRVYEKNNKKAGMADMYINISELFLNQGDYPKATDYSMKALKVDQDASNKNGMGVCYNELGKIAEKQNDTLAARSYFIKALDLFRENGNNNRYAGILANLGDLARDRGELEVALRYDDAALKMYIEMDHVEGQSVTYTNMGRIYGDMKKIPLALDYFRKGIAIAAKNKLIEQLQTGYYDLSRLQSRTGDFKGAYENYSLYTQLKDSLINRKNIQRLAETELTYMFEKKENKIRDEQEKKEAALISDGKRRQVTFIAIITVLLLSLTVIFLLFNRQKLKARKDKIIFEQQEALLQSEKQKTEEELGNAKKQLDIYTGNLILKSRMIDDFREEIAKLSALKSKEIYSEKIEQLDSLNKLIILTNDDWDKFRELFEQVHKGFFVKLKDKLPGLTNAEIRIVCLMKLNIDNKQMANMLGVSPDTIVKTKYRLRKKMSPAEGEDFESIVKAL
ncbi:MAG: tetratricopeptide repeat protein [Bacteroidia bacterium]